MKPSLILVRHSTPAIDPSMPSTEWPLSSAGIDVAKLLASHLATFNPVRLLSSAEQKAHETAEIIGAKSCLNIEVDRNLHEHKRDSGGFLPVQDFENGIAALFRFPRVKTFGDESAMDVFARIDASLSIAQSGGLTVAVSHGTALSIYMSQRFGIDGFAFWRGLKTPMAIFIESNRWSLMSPEGSRAR